MTVSFGASAHQRASAQEPKDYAVIFVVYDRAFQGGRPVVQELVDHYEKQTR